MSRFLRFDDNSACSTEIAIWIFIVLLLVASATEINQDNIINTTNSPVCYNYNYQQDCEWLNNIQDSSVNFTHAYRGLINIFVNKTCVYDPSSITYTELEINDLTNTVNDSDKSLNYRESKLNDVSIYTTQKINPIYYYANDVYHLKLKSTSAFNNKSRRFVNENEKRRSSVNYKWKRRTLCAVQDEKSSTRTFEDNIPNDSSKKTGIKTLMDYDEPLLTDDGEDPSSSENHVRVKRSRSDSSPFSSLRYQQEYLKDLANSFPRNTYESIDENLYDDDISFDAKREIKSQEFSVNEDETDGSKIIDTHPSAVSSSNENDKFIRSNSISTPSGEILTDNSQSSNHEIPSAKESSKDDASLINRRSIDGNMEIQRLPEDLLEVELVRKKRNNLIGKTVSDSRSLNDKTVQHLSTEDENQKSSSLVSANLKAHLLRLKRKAKNNRRDKSSKTRKKKKHSGKKEDKNSRRSLGNARTKSANKLRTPRERKTNGARSEGKSNVGVTKVVSKKNNKNNFHRRFVESKKSKNDRSSKNLASGNNADNSEFIREPSLPTGSDADDLTAGSEDNSDARNQNEKQQVFRETTKLREKRDKNTEASHGFLSKEDELRYYENIREPEPETHRYADKRQRSLMNEIKGERAARSIEEVKELAKKLVTKVNDLQNFINAEESKTNEGRQKRIEARAIDDLCSNVSTAYDAFKETPKIIQKCVSMDHKLSSSPEKITVKRKIHPMKTDKGSKIVNGEKKRSIVRRVPKTTSSTLRTIREENGKQGRKWGRWTDWSSCSVTCGKGRQIRWRYCQRDCSTAETEMEEKACQLPACPPGKFLGIF